MMTEDRNTGHYSHNQWVEAWTVTVNLQMFSDWWHSTSYSLSLCVRPEVKTLQQPSEENVTVCRKVTKPFDTVHESYQSSIQFTISITNFQASNHAAVCKSLNTLQKQLVKWTLVKGNGQGVFRKWTLVKGNSQEVLRKWTLVKGNRQEVLRK